LQGLYAIVLLSLLGGLVGSPAWWFDAKSSFSWDLPPLASRMLASAGVAFLVSALFALSRPTLDRLRLHVILLAVYLAPLVAVIFLFHLDRFDFSQFISWGFFGIAGLMTAAGTYYLVWMPPVEPDAMDAIPPPGPWRAWLATVAAVSAAWGACLFVTDDGFSDLIWVWPGDGLTSRLIGVMLLAVAAGAAFATRSLAASRMMLAVVATYGAGVALANLWNAFNDKPVKEAYLVAFAVLAAASLMLLLLRFADPHASANRQAEAV
jgi:hypothetical protein